jgi:hypothetical protein
MTITKNKKTKMYKASQGNLTYIGINRHDVMQALTRALFQQRYIWVGKQ